VARGTSRYSASSCGVRRRASPRVEPSVGSALLFGTAVGRGRSWPVTRMSITSDGASEWSTDGQQMTRRGSNECHATSIDGHAGIGPVLGWHEAGVGLGPGCSAAVIVDSGDIEVHSGHSGDCVLGSTTRPCTEPVAPECPAFGAEATGRLECHQRCHGSDARVSLGSKAPVQLFKCVCEFDGYTPTAPSIDGAAGRHARCVGRIPLPVHQHPAQQHRPAPELGNFPVLSRSAARPQTAPRKARSAAMCASRTRSPTSPS
jgi:hypothetical protein